MFTTYFKSYIDIISLCMFNSLYIKIFQNCCFPTFSQIVLTSYRVFNYFSRQTADTMFCYAVFYFYVSMKFSFKQIWLDVGIVIGKVKKYQLCCNNAIKGEKK